MFKKKAHYILFIILALIIAGCLGFGGSPKQPMSPGKAETGDKPAQKAEAVAAEQQKKAADEKARRLEEKYQIGYKAFIQGDRATAINMAEEILREDGNNYKAYNLRGIALCYSKNFRAGMENIDRALAIKPDFGYARFNKALAYELYGRFDEAQSWYDKALEVEQFPWSYYGKASIYGRKGDVANTVKYLKKAIELEPGVKEAAREEADFNPVKNSKEFQDVVR